MLRSKRTLSLLLPAAFVALTLAAAPSLAVVGGTTVLTEFSNPTSPYYGMDVSYVYWPKVPQVPPTPKVGSSVAIGYFTLLTAEHYGTDNMVPGVTFLIGTDTFRITWKEQVTTAADLRILHLENLTNKYRPLPGFYDLYTGTFSLTSSLVIVGFGNSGVTSDTSYTETPNTYGVRRWGTNQFTYLLPNPYSYSPYSTRCFRMRYNKADTDYESGFGWLDSGGGVFVKDGNTWKLAGINLYREPNTDPYTKNYAASIPYYASQLYDILQDTKNIGTPLYHPDLLPGDIDLDGNVDASDYITLKENFGMTVPRFTQGDFNGDGLVGYDDLLALTTNFGYTHHPVTASPIGGSMSGGGTAMPEPGSAILLVLGAAALLRRRGGESKRRLATA